MGSKPEYDDYAELQTRTKLAGHPLHQALVTLSKKNTQKLLEGPTKALQSHGGDAAATFARLKELNPDVASQFKTKDHALDSLTLRLILPEDEAPTNSTNVVPSYLVVSYCWHSEEWEDDLAPAAKAGLEPDAKGWEISQPMVKAVMSLRNSSEGVWLDKLSINQEDEDEKKRHIDAMDIIYQSARQLVILLEDVQLTKERAISGLAYAKFYQDLSEEVERCGYKGQQKSDIVRNWFPDKEREYRSTAQQDVIAGIKDFAMNILDARWYSRAWCAHESRVTQHKKTKNTDNPLFLCFGHDGKVLNFEFRFIHYLSIYLHGKELEPSPENQNSDSLDPFDTWRDPTPKTLEQFRFRIQRLLGAHDPNESAMQHIVHIMSSGCTKKRVLMSIALNTSGIPLSFNGEINEVEDVVWIFSLLVLASDDLVPLTSTDASRTRRLRLPDPKFPNDPDKRLISWAPVVSQAIVDDRLPVMTPGTITSVTGAYIELDLLVFKALPSKPSPEALELASRIMEEDKLDVLAREITDAADLSGEKHAPRDAIAATLKSVARDGTGSMAVYHKVWLAHALDCTLDWMLRFADIMWKNTTDSGWIYEPIGGESDPRFTSAAESFLKHFFKNSSPEEYESQRSQHLPSIIRCLTTLFDPRLPFFTIAPRRLPVGNRDHAFVGPSSNCAYIAVPVALAHLPAHTKRMWPIEPFDPDAEPENLPDDHLPDLTKVYPYEAEEADVFPVLTSDAEDRRAPINHARGTWRLRRREDIFGFQGWEVPVKEEDFPEGGEVIYLKRQRVYGAENYDWGAINEARRNLKIAPKLQS